MSRREKALALLCAVLLLVIIIMIVGNQRSKTRIAELEGILKTQEEDLKVMGEIQHNGQSREGKTDLKDDTYYKAIIDGLFKEWKKVVGRDAPYEAVVVKDGIVKIYFSDDFEANAFVRSNPEVVGRFVLDYFLKKSGNENATVEYYTSQQKKIFSITGDLLHVKTEKYE